ncbi:MAG: hypothetical protein JWN62_2179 [Acidimicrobiales bacterium]|nr:hypothetical protein [Acidimicrobiales bacterium]
MPARGVAHRQADERTKSLEEGVKFLEWGKWWHMRELKHPWASLRRARMSMLFARQVPRAGRPKKYDLHIVNVGRVAARAASWRVRRHGTGGPPHIDTIVTDLPSTILPGADLLVASVDRDDAPQQDVDIVVRWVQSGGVVEESRHNLH